METNLILTVALAAAIIVVVLALVAVIIYQRWRLGDKNAAIRSSSTRTRSSASGWRRQDCYRHII